MIKRVDFNHCGSFRLNLVSKFIDKLENKFSDSISFVKLRSTVEGKSNTRVGNVNYETKTVKVLLPHRYSNKSMQVKIILGFKDTFSKESIDKVIKSLESWILCNA